jgi:hypothetical protein
MTHKAVKIIYCWGKGMLHSTLFPPYCLRLEVLTRLHAEGSHKHQKLEVITRSKFLLAQLLLAHSVVKQLGSNQRVEKQAFLLAGR